ncbi:MAG: DeoR family transcriptional regulator [Nitriliruptoraceae bacterium]
MGDQAGGPLPARVRRDRMLTLLREKDFLRVSELAERFDVSEVTIRGDLDALHDRGQLRRVRGGAVARAVPPTGFQAEGLLAVQPAAGAPVTILASPDPHREVASIRPELRGEVAMVTADSGRRPQPDPRRRDHRHLRTGYGIRARPALPRGERRDLRHQVARGSRRATPACPLGGVAAAVACPLGGVAAAVPCPHEERAGASRSTEADSCDHLQGNRRISACDARPGWWRGISCR